MNCFTFDRESNGGAMFRAPSLREKPRAVSGSTYERSELVTAGRFPVPRQNEKSHNLLALFYLFLNLMFHVKLIVLLHVKFITIVSAFCLC